MKRIMAAISSPPNELDPDVVMVKEEPSATSAPDYMLDLPAYSSYFTGRSVLN